MPCFIESGAAVCEYFMRNMCNRGPVCPFRHTKGEKTVVCKHWLRGLCKKGDQCEFLHEYDMTKMPECYFYSKFGKFALLLVIIKTTLSSQHCNPLWNVLDKLKHW